MTNTRIILACAAALALFPARLLGAVTVDTSDRMRFVTYAADGKLVADGRTAVVLTIHGEDAQHVPLPDANVDVTVLTGNAVLEPLGPLDPMKPHDGRRVTGATGKNGDLQVRVVAGMIAGTVELAIVSGPVTTTDDLYATPYARTPIVTGLVSGGFGTTPGSTDGAGVFDNGGSKRGRVAISATGSLGNGIVATGAYETANRLYPDLGFGPNVADPDSRDNPTYGDASLRSAGPQSRPGCSRGSKRTRAACSTAHSPDRPEAATTSARFRRCSTASTRTSPTRITPPNSARSTPTRTSRTAAPCSTRSA